MVGKLFFHKVHGNFSSLLQSLRETTSKEGRFNLFHPFVGFSPWSGGSTILRTTLNKTIMAGPHVRTVKTPTLYWPWAER